MMCSYHHLWLSMLVIAILTTSMCGFANEVEISENSPHMRQDDAHHHLEAQAAPPATFQEMTDSGSLGAAAVTDHAMELFNSLRFEPNELDFGIGSVGIVRSHVVTLINLNRNRSVHLNSVSGRTPVIYSSFFEAKMLPPNSNTTFNVVFLARDQGVVSTTLIIHTSFGNLKLMVSGEGRECPYRLKPLVGLKAPLNATLMPEIHMYNPHGKTLKILEVYSSGGQFQLELPSGDPEAPQQLWEIPPFSTKPVIRIRFHGLAAGNYSAYIRIKIAQTHNGADASKSSDDPPNVDEQILVIPVEFEILSEYGLYAVNPLLEFGYLAMGETTEPFKQKINLRHSKSHLEQLNDFKFESLTYIKGVKMADDDMISTVLIDPADIYEPMMELNEKLQLVLKDTSAAYTYHNVEIIIRANIFKGSLHYNDNSTIFLDSKASPVLTNSGNEIERTLQLRNDFHIPLAICNVTTMSSTNSSEKLSLHLKPFDRILTLQPGTSWDLTVAYRLATNQEDNLKDLLRNYKTAIFVHTNVTTFEIPIVISSTSLFVTTQTQTIWRSNNSVYTKELQLSSIPVREASQNGYVILQNRNSVPIKLKSWNFEKSPGLYYSIFSRGCMRAADVNRSSDYSVDLEIHFEICDELYEGDIAAFVLTVTPYATGLNTAYLKITTDYENITVAVKFNTVMGKLEVDQEKLHFTDCFPGKLCSSELSIRSSFKQPIFIKHINFTVPGLIFEDISPHGSKIEPQAVTTVGRMYFEPSALCSGSCYIPQQTDAHDTFLANNGAHKPLPPFNEVELRRRIELYKHFKYYFQNIDFVLTSQDLQYFQLNLMVELKWPHLAEGHQVLPIIGVNKVQTYDVKILNPSDQPILVDYHLADPMLTMQTLISLPLEAVMLTPNCYLSEKAVFSLVTQAPKKPILIPALSSIKVAVRFQTESIGGCFCTLLHVRNNLTLFEGIWISAKAVQSQFRLGNRKPGSQTPLLFEITEQQLELACSRKTEFSESRVLQPQIVTRRVFTARNSGELPIKIDGFLIGDEECRGYGFQVTNCSSFLLKANSTKTIEIVFFSDFTVTRITKPLILKTNLTYDVSYTLVAQLPSTGLDQCNVLLARPPWEKKIRNASVVMLVVSFVLVLIAVHIDYGNIMYQSSLYGAREKGQVHPTFNLRNIAMSPSSGQNNNETPSLGDVEASQKVKTSAGLRKRNVNKSQKQTNGDSSSFDGLTNTMTLAEMVSWTFGTKTTKKPLKVTKGKDVATTEIFKNTSTALATTDSKSSDGSTKLKFNEKSLIDRMDEDLKRTQNCKNIKSVDKPSQNQEEKPHKEKVDDGEKKRYKAAKVTMKAVTATSTTSVTHEVNNRGQQECRDQKKAAESYLWEPFATSAIASDSKVLPTTEINQQSHLPKDSTNGRKMGKTPGRERRKHSAQNTSPATSSCSSNSTSSSAAAATGKRYERKIKSKSSNALKFLVVKVPNQSNPAFPPLTAESSINETCDQGFYPDILSPWQYGSQIGFHNIMQPKENGQTTRAPPMATLNTSPTALINTDLVNHSLSLSDAMAADTHPTRNSEFSTRFESFNKLDDSKEKRSSASDLGPIGSRKSLSSSPNWESHNHSAITMQLPRPLNTTTASTSFNQPPQQHNPQNLYTETQHPQYQQMSSTYGYNEQLSPTQAQKQHELDITAKLLEIQAHEELVRRYMEQLLLAQQHQQYLNYLQALQNDWSSSHFNTSASAWSPIMDNLNATNNFATMSSNEPSLPSSSSAAWSMDPTPGGLVSTASSNGIMRSSPQMLDHNFPNHYMAGASSSSTSMANTAVYTGAVSPPGHSSSKSSSAVSHNNSNGTEVTANGVGNATEEDNMPMFNLFGGLSSIWNDNWKESTASQQQEKQQKSQNAAQQKEE